MRLPLNPNILICRLRGIRVNLLFYIKILLINPIPLAYYGLSVISVTVTKGGHPRGSGLYGTSRTIGRGVSRVT